MFRELSLFGGGSDDGTFVPFTDMLLNVLMGFSIMVFISLALIRPEIKTTANVSLKAEYLITVNWPDNNPDDIDTYVEDPAGNLIWYRHLEAGFLALERDDRGMYKDTLIVDGKRIQNPLNQEIVTMRSIVPGEYVVNVFHYLANSVDPIPVTVNVQRLNPTVQVVYSGTVMLDHRGDEKTAIRFTLDKDGVPSHLSQRFVSLAALASGVK
jgi:hypothetical protein